MKLLFLTSRLPYPPDRGDRLRAYHFLRRLAADHEIHLVSFVASPREREYLPALAPFCQAIHILEMPPLRSALTVLLNLYRPAPLQTLYYRHSAMSRLINQVLSSMSFQAAYVHLFRMAPYVEHHPGLYRIVDLTDVISTEVQRSLPYRGAFSRLLYTLERPRISRYEKWVANHFEETWLISTADRDALAATCPGANLRTITNGVDLEALHPTGAEPVPGRLIFVGHMGVLHNIDAAELLARQVLPLVRRLVPEASLQIVGADPARRVQSLAALPGVEVTGFVPDLNNALNKAAVFVAPLRFAAGIQNKVLEAMAAGRPVITTPMVNEGLGAEPGEDLLLAESPASIAASLVELLPDAEARSRIGAAGRRFVGRTFSWDHAGRRMAEIERALIDNS